MTGGDSAQVCIYTLLYILVCLYDYINYKIQKNKPYFLVYNYVFFWGVKYAEIPYKIM